MDTNNIGENLCSVITMVSKSLLEGLKYDTTIECTVIDDSKRDAGEYRVSNGSTSFIALSTSKYKNNDKVYVTIPGGDYDNDKLIIGKVSAKDAQEPYNYIAPLTSFYNISGNLNSKPNDKWSLLANDDRGESYQVKQIFVEDNLSLAGFTRLGLKASFKSWLPTQDCISGDYGLRLEVTFKVDKTVNGDSEFDYVTKELFLNTQDMIGNPYAFETEFNQEKMFNISGLGEIVGIKVFFLQSDPGTFIDRQGKPVTYYSEIEKVRSYLPDNIWVSNIEIGVGYDINDYPGEFLQLYTLDSLYYNPKCDAETNRKEIALRWLHEGPNGKYQINQNSTEEPFEIRWYKYKLGNPSPDEYAGVNWELINLEDDSTCGRRFTAVFDPEIKQQQESVKVIILYGEAPGYYDYAKNTVTFENKDAFDKDFKNYYVKENANNKIYYRRLTRDDWEEINNLTLAYKVDNREVYHSEPIVFKNEKAMPSESTMAALSALKIYCYDVEDGEQTLSAGNYLLYNEQNELIDKAQSQINRHLVWGLDIDDFDVNNVSNITWTFPTDKTMIAAAGLSDEDLTKGSITIADGKAGNEQYDRLNGFKYHIKNKYSISNTNNVIGLSVTHSGIVYTAAIELSFGQAGTMGSKGTFVIDFADARTAITVGEKDTPIKLVARLYGVNGDEISLNSYSIEWDWYIRPSMLHPNPPANSGKRFKNGLEFLERTNSICSLQVNDNLECSHIYIIKATLKGWQTESINGSYDLIAFLPISIRASGDYRYITGADKIVYLSDGTPQYYDSYYVMHGINNTAIYEGWEIIPYYTYQEDNIEIAEDETYQLSGKIINHNINETTTVQACKLDPSPLYYEGSTTYYAARYSENGEVKWTQPILIIQSRYFSSAINDWDGKTISLKEEDGEILASRIGAGRKNSSNQFSGVLMGDWSEKIEGNTITNTGLYGFRDGLLSFGFKDDGTAFIGTKTKGQLQFDGNESTITSASYREGKSNGMLLDFDNPKILMRQGFKDDIRVGKRTNNVYEEYGYFNKQVDWDGLDRTKLYRKDESTGEYKSVKSETWNVAYAELNNGDGILLYELVSSVENILPILVKKQEDFNKLFEDYPEAKYFDIANAEGTGYIQVTKSNGWLDSYSGQYFYYPGGESENRTVDIDATAQQKPLTIGKNFSVEWDGTLNAVDGNFSGNINAKSGKITGTLEVTGTLSGGTIIGAHIQGSYVSASQFYADYGTIGGWTISKNTLKSKNGTMTLNSSDGSITGGILRATGGSIELEGFLSVGNGKIGQVDSGATGEGDKTGIGLRYTGTDGSNSEVKATEANTGMKFNNAFITMENDNIWFQTSSSGYKTCIRLWENSNRTISLDGNITIPSTSNGLSRSLTVNSIADFNNKVTMDETEINNLTIDGDLDVSQGDFQVADSKVTISANELWVTTSAANQHGIYARFA